MFKPHQDLRADRTLDMQLEFHCPRRNRFAPNLKLKAQSDGTGGKGMNGFSTGMYVKEHLTKNKGSQRICQGRPERKAGYPGVMMKVGAGGPEPVDLEKEIVAESHSHRKNNLTYLPAKVSRSLLSVVFNHCLNTYRRLSTRSISRFCSRSRMLWRLSNSRFPFARASVILALPPLK